MAKWAAIVVGTLVVVWLLIRIVPSIGDSKKWSRPTVMSRVEERYGSGISFHHWNGTIVGMRSGGLFYFSNEQGRWAERIIPEFKDRNCYPIVMDANGPKAIFREIEFPHKKGKGIVSFIDVSLTNGRVRVGAKTLVPDFFPNEGTNRAGYRRETSLMLGRGMLENSDQFVVPYFTSVSDITERITSAGILQTESRSSGGEWGLLNSTNGTAWELTRLGAIKNYGSANLHATSKLKYLLRTESPHEVWCSTQPLEGEHWSEPRKIIDSLQSGGGYLVESEDDRLHLCWMDMRLKKGVGFFIYGDWDVGRKNNQVFYGNADSKNKWSKQKKLSGNFSYCESPTMSVEGQNIVVAWHHYLRPYTRAAIYYATSKNNGRTWSWPRRIDSPNDISCEKPQVILHQGIIHLFYDRILGRQGNCDLMYQRRKFPE